MKEITNKYMAKKIKPAEDENIFKVKGDGTIERIGNADLQNNEHSALDKEILDIIEVNSYSKNILAAYKGRKLANKICKEEYGKMNYREYVEMLMVKHFPKEHEKSELGAKYMIMLCLSPLLVFALIFLWAFVTYGISSYGYEKVMGILATIICLALLGLFIWKLIIPIVTEIKEIQNNK
jgi:hypothetical protein